MNILDDHFPDPKWRANEQQGWGLRTNQGTPILEFLKTPGPETNPRNLKIPSIQSPNWGGFEPRNLGETNWTFNINLLQGIYGNGIYTPWNQQQVCPWK